MLPVYKLDFAFSNRKKTCLFTKGHTEEDICMHLFYIPVEHPLGRLLEQSLEYEELWKMDHYAQSLKSKRMMTYLWTLWWHMGELDKGSKPFSKERKLWDNVEFL